MEQKHIVVNIKNISGKEKRVKIFGACKYLIKDGWDETGSLTTDGVKITSELKSGESYRDILKSLKESPFPNKLMYFESIANYRQLGKRIYYVANDSILMGDKEHCHRFYIHPLIDPYGGQHTILQYPIAFCIDDMAMLETDVLPDAEFRIWLMNTRNNNGN